MFARLGLTQIPFRISAAAKAPCSIATPAQGMSLKAPMRQRSCMSMFAKMLMTLMSF
jgi:hypothetical protein